MKIKWYKLLCCKWDRRTKEQIIDDFDDTIVPIEKEIEEMEGFF